MKRTKLKSLVSLQEEDDDLMVANLWDNWRKKKPYFIFLYVIVIKAKAGFHCRLQNTQEKAKTVVC